MKRLPEFRGSCATCASSAAVLEIGRVRRLVPGDVYESNGPELNAIAVRQSPCFPVTASSMKHADWGVSTGLQNASHR